MPEILCLIPARAGSKGVPRKNRRDAGGIPLISHTIRAARAATTPSAIVVSTDDSEIVAIARDEGVEAIVRPGAYAADHSPVIDAVRHVLATRAEQGASRADVIVLLQPTSPFREPGDIDAAIALFLASGRTPICSVYQTEDAHPARMYRIVDGHLESLMPELASVRRQDLPPVYHRNGSIYVFGPAEVASGRIISDHMIPYVMPVTSSVNVDTEIDLLLVNAILEERAEAAK
ncbi:acylneuraminate cytidylyltransferase family protein [Sphingomonas sp. CFBP 13728]|uniref:acylneuraminate cytidylyltransferase family protein n=1 Tax=Sphingomonas sp. CFBP 13728 TaxID=2775294 RepID=UPI00177D7FD6|nr:acylneuraminate cytidylyltransferase family protein [Sphingomonas sp. CFBP 13728]MBD8620615.1 acylneuraminate cytidylyltransferase family protein [Sphingomonas sp. CFBP 13728]